MKYYFFIVALVLFAGKCFGQEENWDTYMSEISKKPASVLVDLALHDKLPNSALSYLLVTGPRSKLCQGNGLPLKTEIDEMEEVLSTTSTFVTGVTPKVLAGTLTYNCERLNYYYVKDTVGLGYAIARMYNRNYQGYQYVFKIKYDPDWTVYKDFLYPNEETFTWMENDKIITHLINQGDSLIKRRDISFEVYFAKEEDRKSFVEFARKNNFNVIELNHIKNLDTQYQIKISQNDYIKPDIITELTTAVKKAAKKYNGKYMRWASPVVK